MQFSCEEFAAKISYHVELALEVLQETEQHLENVTKI